MSGWRPGRWSPRAATTSAAPSTWPPGSPPTPAPARSWSASASPRRPRPAAWSSERPARSSSRGSPIRCGCWRPTGRERLTPRLRLARPRRQQQAKQASRGAPGPDPPAPAPAGRRAAATSAAAGSALDEPLDERERLVGGLTPAVVDDQRVPVAGDLLDLGHTRVVLLLLVGGVDDRRRDGVVPLAGDKQQRATVGVLGVDLVLGPGIQVGQGGLPQRLAGGRHRELLIQLLGLVLTDGVGEAVAELVVGQRHRPGPVGRVAQHR